MQVVLVVELGTFHEEERRKQLRENFCGLSKSRNGSKKRKGGNRWGEDDDDDEDAARRHQSRELARSFIRGEEIFQSYKLKSSIR